MFSDALNEGADHVVLSLAKNPCICTIKQGQESFVAYGFSG